MQAILALSVFLVANPLPFKAKFTLIELDGGLVFRGDLEHERIDLARQEGFADLLKKEGAQASTTPARADGHGEEHGLADVGPGPQQLAGTDDGAIGLKQECAAMSQHEACRIPAPGGLGKGHEINLDHSWNERRIVLLHFGHSDFEIPTALAGKRHLHRSSLFAPPNP
jgi:hypothetical protein